MRAFTQLRRRHGQERSAAPAAGSSNRPRWRCASSRSSRTGSGTTCRGDPQRFDPTLLVGQAGRVNAPPPLSPEVAGRLAGSRAKLDCPSRATRGGVRSGDVRDHDTAWSQLAEPDADLSLLVQPRARGPRRGTKSRAVGAISYASQFNVMVVASAAQKPIPAGTVEARRFSQPKLMNGTHPA